MKGALVVSLKWLNHLYTGSLYLIWMNLKGIMMNFLRVVAKKAECFSSYEDNVKTCDACWKDQFHYEPRSIQYVEPLSGNIFAVYSRTKGHIIREVWNDRIRPVNSVHNSWGRYIEPACG